MSTERLDELMDEVVWAARKDNHHNTWPDNQGKLTAARDALKAYVAALRSSSLTSEEADYLDYNVHIPHEPVCNYWREDDDDTCNCIASRLYEKLQRISSLPSPEGQTK